MDMLYLYRIILGPFLYELIDEQKSYLLNAGFASRDKALFFQDLSSQIPSLSILPSLEVLQGSNNVQVINICCNYSKLRF